MPVARSKVAAMSRSYGRGRGFTLIELLVVLVILGTLVSLAVLSVGNGAGRALRDEGDRLATVMALLLKKRPWTTASTACNCAATVTGCWSMTISTAAGSATPTQPITSCPRACN